MIDFNNQISIGIVGAGAVGGALAISLNSAGYNVSNVASRSIESSNRLAEQIQSLNSFGTIQEVAKCSDLVFITTPDNIIEQIANETKWRNSQGVVHCSGVSSLDILNNVTSYGAIPGSFHPMQAFADATSGARNIPGITFGIEGEKLMVDFLTQMAKDLLAKPIILNAESKPLYHLTGVMMGGLLTSLAIGTAALWDKIGMDRDQGIEALIPMMKGVINNLNTLGVPNAIAGPYARGDLGTIKTHMLTLKKQAPEVLPLYCEMALMGLSAAIEKNTLDKKTEEAIRRCILDFKKGK